MIHVVAVAGLGGASMATPVVGDDAIAVLEKEQHLRIPVVGRERPTVAEDDGLSAAPVLVVNFDVRSIFSADRDVRHDGFLGLIGANRSGWQLSPNRILSVRVPRVTTDSCGRPAERLFV